MAREKNKKKREKREKKREERVTEKVTWDWPMLPATFAAWDEPA